jgi:hypothetical protein
MVVVHAMYHRTCAECFLSMPCSALSCRVTQIIRLQTAYENHHYLVSDLRNKMRTIADTHMYAFSFPTDCWVLRSMLRSVIAHMQLFRFLGIHSEDFL